MDFVKRLHHSAKWLFEVTKMIRKYHQSTIIQYLELPRNTGFWCLTVYLCSCWSHLIFVSSLVDTRLSSVFVVCEPVRSNPSRLTVADKKTKSKNSDNDTFRSLFVFSHTEIKILSQNIKFWIG